MSERVGASIQLHEYMAMFPSWNIIHVCIT